MYQQGAADSDATWLGWILGQQNVSLEDTASQELRRLQGDARPHLQQFVPQKENCWHETHMRQSPMLLSAHAFHWVWPESLVYEEVHELCVCLSGCRSGASVWCVLMSCWNVGVTGWSQFCLMCSHEPLRDVLVGSHTATFLLCLLVLCWELGRSPQTHQQERCVFTWCLSAVWGQDHTLVNWISTKRSSILKLAVLKLKIIFSFITRTYF